MSRMRLDKLLSMNGVSRSQAIVIVRSGAVTVNGEPVLNSATIIDTEGADIRLNGRVENMHKRAHQSIKPQATHYKPYCRTVNSVKERQHHKDKDNIKYIRYDKNGFFTPFAYTKRSQEHTPQRSVTVNRNHQTVLRA